ncbi:unnamed protein product [Adineta ricciae]|uniref:Uncharacterized protein n=1 Tax=Adineta ricciae TaxID=249248 RepID=A0A813S6E3_ADIRI|nr:unnamed protein product [Adineta ricciae]
MQQSYSQSYNAAQHVDPTIAHSISQRSGAEEQWKHFLSDINPYTTSKLTIAGVFYIILAIIAIAIDIRLIIDVAYFPFSGLLYGVFLIALGILTIILSRQQIYVLTNLFILVFFQLLITIATLVVKIIAVSDTINDSNSCSQFYDNCDRSEQVVLQIANIVHCVIVFCLLITTFVLITRARRTSTTQRTVNYVAYVPRTYSIPTSFQNPCATMNDHQSSSA